jgi:regulator of RNase E activity RraA
MGGIMAVRMAKLGAKAIVVDGRVRDVGEMERRDIPVWSRGVSTIGAGAQAKAWAVNVEVQIGETVVEPVGFRHRFLRAWLC